MEKRYANYVKTSFGLKRKQSDDIGDIFVIRKANHGKNTLKFVNFANAEIIQKCKAWYIAEIQKMFNDNYEGLATLSLDSLDFIPKAQPKKNELVNYYSKRINECLSSREIRIINREGKDGEHISETICSILKNKGFNAILTSQKGLDDFAIYVIHDRDYYERNNLHDKYLDSDVIASNHITIENFEDDPEDEIDTILENLVIKDDILNRKISLDDVSSRHFNSKLTFALAFDDNDETMVGFMDMDTSGNINFSLQSLFDIKDARIASAIQEDKVEGLVIQGDNINIIEKTDIITVPDMYAIKEQIEENEKNKVGTLDNIRNKDGRKRLLSEVIDINVFEIDNNHTLYYCGEFGQGINTSVKNASNIRSVRAVENSKLFFDEIIQLMVVPFVRNKQLTVLPYPFKYLREKIGY